MASIDLQAHGQVTTNTPIGPYRLTPSGSARSMAIGGAYTGLSNDVTGLTYNPAGMVFGNWSFDLSVTQTRLTDRETLNDNQQSDFSKTSDVTQGAIAIRLTKWLVISAGMSQPYQLDLEGYQYEASVNNQCYDSAISMKYQQVSLGIGYHQETMTQEITDLTSGLNLSEKADTGYFRVGFLWQAKKGRLGASYISAKSFDMETSKNSQLSGNGNWFRDGEVPSKTSIGLALQASKNFLLAIDFDKFAKHEKQIIYPGSGEILFWPNTIYINSKEQSLLHGGFEWTLHSSKTHDIIVRGGYYNEPARILGNQTRAHTTYGAEVRFGPAKLTVSFDQAKNYRHSAQGFSLVLGHL